jgi:hypothetical protein
VTKPQAAREEPSSDIKYLGLRVSPEIHKKLKILAIEKNTCLQDLCLEAIERLLDVQ